MKKLSALLAALLVTATVSALSVDRDELNSTMNTTVEFINYVGPHKVIDSLEAIKAIGTGLGKEIGKDVSVPSETGNKAKYYVIHAIDPDTKGKLDADILFIGKDALVDHIRNLRHIIAAYLRAAYGYSEQDAQTIATFVTVYNAVYRGNMDYYSSKYKKVVTDNLTTSNCGLDVNYKNWPGKSEIVIPLFDVNGGISTVDTSVISDSKVVDSMQEDDDKNIDSRKDMVDLKEREAEKATEKAQESQKKATEEQKKLTEEKKKTEEAQKKADDTKKKAEETKKEAAANPNDKQKQEAAASAQKEADKAEKNLNEQKESEKKQEQKTEEAKQEAKDQQTVADKKTSEAQTERKEIAKDQKEVQDREAAEAKMTADYGLTLVDDAGLFSRLVKYNAEDGAAIKDSPVTTIRSRTVYETENGFLAVCGENLLNGTVKLALLDKDTMEITDESSETLSDASVLVKDGDDYYCVIMDGKSAYVGKYGSDLKLKLKSKITVKSATPITVTETAVVVTASNGKYAVLSKEDLSPLENSGNGSSSSKTAVEAAVDAARILSGEK
ncbi:MAG: hypothetical protein MJ181_07920 [Treponema sp.]|nr:hypothetical protein [Treponema sp.]